MVKEYLSQRGIVYKEYDVSQDRNAAQELVSKTGQMGVPVTLIGGKTIVGFDKVQLEEAIKQRQKPSFGALVADASRITAKQGIGITLGAYVGKVNPGSLAERLGLAAGDILIEINMQRIANAADVEKTTTKLSKGNRVFVLFLREEQQHAAEGIL
ncbi:glutaredoxin domain-containing protein [Chloroflexota bacterium]